MDSTETSDHLVGNAMSSVSLPVTRPAGRALVIGSGGCRARPLSLLGELGYACGEADDPYAAMAELCRRPAAYRALILSLQSVYKEELSLIPTVRQRFPQVEVWLTDTDGRQGTLAEAMRLGAEGLLADDGLHRIAVAPPVAASIVPSSPAPVAARPIAPAAQPASPRARGGNGSRRVLADSESHPVLGEPVLTADELRALLSDPVPMPVPGKAD